MTERPRPAIKEAPLCIIPYVHVVDSCYFAIKPITTYRSWSDPDYEVGGYVSRTRPAGPLQTQLDLALAPQWGNKANHISEYEIPQFAPFYEGAAGVQPVKAIEDSDTLGQLPGGGNQILITDKQVLDRWKSKK